MTSCFWFVRFADVVIQFTATFCVHVSLVSCRVLPAAAPTCDASVQRRQRWLALSSTRGVLPEMAVDAFPPVWWRVSRPSVGTVRLWHFDIDPTPNQSLLPGTASLSISCQIRSWMSQSVSALCSARPFS